MKPNPLASLLLAMLLLLGGCESMSEGMRDRFSAVPPKVQVFAGDQDLVSAAALQAFKRLDFTVTRAKGSDIEAVSRIHTSVAFADSRQQSVKLHLSAVGPSQTEVGVTLTEQVQSQSMGGTSQQTMRDHGFFDLYFATLQQVLDEPALDTPDKKN
jgi:hypothetical protein